ncbi:MAG: ATPase [Haloarculaceae archaeon]
MTLLVAGSERVGAGKTTFSLGLVARTGAVGFKPRAGNDRWFDQDDVSRALAEGRLYGTDAARLASASPGDRTPERINPVHRLWQPSPGPGTGLLGRNDREFVLDRVGEHWVRNGTVDLPPDVRESLGLEREPDSGEADGVGTDGVEADVIGTDGVEANVIGTDSGGTETVATVGSLDELNEITALLHLPAMDRVADRISSVDRAVVESYGDVARPLQTIRPEAVAVVEPGRARIYDGARYRNACEVASGSPHEGQLEERAENVVDLLDPASREALPALGRDERADPGRISAAYEPAYDALLSIAGWS